MAYACELDDKQFREGEGGEYVDDNGQYFFCSMECWEEWMRNKETK